jgi:hypothetical protein
MFFVQYLSVITSKHVLKYVSDGYHVLQNERPKQICIFFYRLLSQFQSYTLRRASTLEI